MLDSIHFCESALSQVALDLIRISQELPVLKQSQDGYPRNTSLTVILRNLQRSHLKACPQRQWVFGHRDKRASLLGQHSSGKVPSNENRRNSALPSLRRSSIRESHLLGEAGHASGRKRSSGTAQS